MEYLNKFYEKTYAKGCPMTVLAIDGKKVNDPKPIHTKKELKQLLEDEGFNTENIEIL